VSARDLLISLRNFDDFSFDKENEIMELGVGQDWATYYKKMEEVAPDYTDMFSEPIGSDNLSDRRM